MGKTLGKILLDMFVQNCHHPRGSQRPKFRSKYKGQENGGFHREAEKIDEKTHHIVDRIFCKCVL